jgi:hypothetical protein
MRSVADSLRAPVPPQQPTTEAAQESPAEAAPEAASETDLSQGEQQQQQEAAPEAKGPEDDGDGHDTWPKSAVERVKKLKAKNQKLKAEVEALKAGRDDDDGEAQAKPATQSKPTPDNPFGEVTDAAEIQRIAEQAEATESYVDRLIDDLADDPASVERSLRQAGVKLGEGEDAWSTKAMRDYLRQVRESARVTVKSAPKRLEFLRAEEQSIQQAARLMPELKEEDSEETQMVAQIVANFPQLLQRPDWAIQSAIYVLGKREMQKRTARAPAPATAAAAKPEPKPAPKPPVTAGIPRTAPATRQPDELDAARAKLTEKKGHDSMVDYARAALRRSAG